MLSRLRGAASLPRAKRYYFAMITLFLEWRLADYILYARFSLAIYRSASQPQPAYRQCTARRRYRRIPSRRRRRQHQVVKGQLHHDEESHHAPFFTHDLMLISRNRRHLKSSRLQMQQRCAARKKRDRYFRLAFTDVPPPRPARAHRRLEHKPAIGHESMMPSAEASRYSGIAPLGQPTHCHARARISTTAALPQRDESTLNISSERCAQDARRKHDVTATIRRLRESTAAARRHTPFRAGHHT